MIQKKLEERIQTHAERELLARQRIREELIALTIAGELEKLRRRLKELADEAEQRNERPRGTAEVRDDRGCTLLALAVQHNKEKLVNFLLTHWKVCKLMLFHNPLSDPFILKCMIDH